MNVTFFFIVIGSFLLRVEAPAQTNRPTTSLCSALEQVRPAEPMQVTVSGVYEVGPESQLFYDPQERFCAVDIQPATWVEFQRSAASPDLNGVLATDHRAYVTFTGTLYGPEATKEDDARLSPNVAAANRMSRRYGHLNAFRTKLVVTSVGNVRRVPPDLPTYAASFVAPGCDLPPQVQHAEVPRYPELARRAGITGLVVADVEVADGRVVNTRIQSGDRLLANEVTENVRTWRFSPTVATTFRTTFEFMLERRPRGSNSNPVVELRLPTTVKIAAPTDEW